MNSEILNSLMNEVNLENSLVIVNLLNSGLSVSNICVDSVIVESGSLIFTGRRSAFIDKLSLKINDFSVLDIDFNENSMCYSLIWKDNRMDFYIHT